MTRKSEDKMKTCVTGHLWYFRVFKANLISNYDKKMITVFRFTSILYLAGAFKIIRYFLLSQ
jgi:hypothetical protein